MQNNVSPTHPKVTGEPENLGAAAEDDTAGHIRARSVDETQSAEGFRALRVEEDEDTEGHLRSLADAQPEGFLARLGEAGTTTRSQEEEDDTEGHLRSYEGDEAAALRALRVQEVKSSNEEG